MTAATAPALKAEVTELPESRVRVQVEVPSEEIERSVATTARTLARSLKLPGFRKGKVPPELVIRRLGREHVLDEAVRDGIPGWYAQALASAALVTVGEPRLEVDDLPEPGRPLTFTIEVGVRPTARLGEYRGLEVPRREPAASPEDIEREIEGLRDRMARLETTEEPAQLGDFVVADFAGSIEGDPIEGASARDRTIELGAGRLIPGFEEGLVGARGGDQRTLELKFPESYSEPELAGKPATFEIAVKDVRRKLLPALDDDLAAEAGYDSLEELRADVTKHLLEDDEHRVEAEFREAAVDAAVEQAKVDVPPGLIAARARELWDRTVRTLARQGIGEQAYMQIAGKTREELVEEAGPAAEQDLRRQAVLAAIIDAEGIEVTESDQLTALGASAEREGVEPAILLERLRSSGVLEDLNDELSVRRAIDLLAAEAKPIPIERARARERLWTPGQDEALETGSGSAAIKGSAATKGRAATKGAGTTDPDSGLWTPGDAERSQ